jgi:hypothetical protein
MMVSTEVAPAEPNNCASPVKSLKISQLSEVALDCAEKPTMGSKTRKLSISCTSATKVASGIRCGITTSRMRSQRLAPSIIADSSVSAGTVCSPA